MSSVRHSHSGMSGRRCVGRTIPARFTRSGRSASVSEVSQRLGTRLVRTYAAPGFGLTHLTHAVEPSLTYLYVPWQDQRSLPQFDRLDFISPQNRLVARLGNQWLGRSRGPDGEILSREIAALEIAQSLNLQPRTREFSDVYLAGLTPERID